MNEAQKLVDGLSGFTPGPWNTDTGGEVHKDGTTIFGWPKWVDQSGDAEIHSNMALGAAAPELLNAVVALIADNAKLRAALDLGAQLVEQDNLENAAGWDCFYFCAVDALGRATLEATK